MLLTRVDWPFPRLYLEDTQRVWLTPLGTPLWGLKHFAEGGCKAVDLTSPWALLPCLTPANTCSFCSLQRNTRFPCRGLPSRQFHFRGFSSCAVARHLTHCEICVHAFVINWCFETFFTEEKNLNQSYARLNKLTLELI